MYRYSFLMERLAGLGYAGLGYAGLGRAGLAGLFPPLSLFLSFSLSLALVIVLALNRYLPPHVFSVDVWLAWRVCRPTGAADVIDNVV